MILAFSYIKETNLTEKCLNLNTSYLQFGGKEKEVRCYLSQFFLLISKLESFIPHCTNNLNQFHTKQALQIQEMFSNGIY